MSRQNNITRIKAVHNALRALNKDVVYIGGAVVSLYADGITYDVRPTDDVDVLVEVYTRVDYALLEEQLREIGFKNDTTANFVGRFILPGILVDIMPTEETILGFSNKWYREGFASSIQYEIDSEHTINIFQTPYFIASKIEAFKARGKNAYGEYDGRFSSDFEDIIYVLENRRAIWNEMNMASEGVREYLIKEFDKMLKHPDIEEWIDSTAGFSSPPMTYYIIENMKDFTGNY